MTNGTVMTMNSAQCAYLRAAVQALLAVQGQAAARHRDHVYEARFCADLTSDLLETASACGTVSPLDHQEGAELMDMLGGGVLELRVPAASGITPFYSDAPGGYAGMVPAEDEVWVVPCTLTIAGAETADEAAVMADTFLGRASLDGVVNADEVVIAFDVGGDDPVPTPSDVAAVEQAAVPA